jgi:hypothetical protein
VAKFNTLIDSKNIYVNYGRHPQTDLFQVTMVGNPVAKDMIQHMSLIHKELIFQLCQA